MNSCPEMSLFWLVIFLFICFAYCVHANEVEQNALNEIANYVNNAGHYSGATAPQIASCPADKICEWYFSNRKGMGIVVNNEGYVVSLF